MLATQRDVAHSAMATAAAEHARSVAELRERLHGVHGQHKGALEARDRQMATAHEQHEVANRATAAEHARSVAELRDAQEQHQRSLDDHAREMAAVVEQHSATVAALHSDHGTAILEARLELAAQAEAAASERKKQQQEWRSRWQAKVVAAEGKGSAGGL